MIKIKLNKMKVILFMILLFFIANAYFFYNYKITNSELDKISFNSNIDIKDLVVYGLLNNASDYDFSNPIHPIKSKNQLVFDIRDKNYRNFRIYIGHNYTKAYMQSLKIDYHDRDEILYFKNLKKDRIYPKSKHYNKLILFSNLENAFFQLKRDSVRVSEFLLLQVYLFLAILILSVFLSNIDFSMYFKSFGIKQLIVSFFIISIFLPPPIPNISFIASFFLLVKDIKFKNILKNKLSLMLIGYFLIILINSLFISEEFNIKYIETTMLMFFLAFYIGCLPNSNYIKLFPLVAVVLSVFFLITSVVGHSITHNPTYFSFDYFTKHLHPIYFSYLLSFSIAYVEINGREFKNRYFIIAVLFLALICSGSKLLIILSAMFLVFQFFRNKIKHATALIVLFVCFILFFKPTRERFFSVLDYNSLQILSESKISNVNDERLNGLTLRLILWQESFKSMDNFKVILFGNGVDKTSDEKLEKRLSDRGLALGHIKYDPHNQYIVTLFKTGIFGFIFLIFICCYPLYMAFKYKNQLLFYSVVLFMTSMFTESLLQRVLGIYFFCVILLFQISFNTNQNVNENSNNRN